MIGCGLVVCIVSEHCWWSDTSTLECLLMVNVNNLPASQVTYFLIPALYYRLQSQGYLEVPFCIGVEVEEILKSWSNKLLVDLKSLEIPPQSISKYFQVSKCYFLESTCQRNSIAFWHYQPPPSFLPSMLELTLKFNTLPLRCIVDWGSCDYYSCKQYWGSRKSDSLHCNSSGHELGLQLNKVQH